TVVLVTENVAIVNKCEQDFRLQHFVQRLCHLVVLRSARVNGGPTLDFRRNQEATIQLARGAGELQGERCGIGLPRIDRIEEFAQWGDRKTLTTGMPDSLWMTRYLPAIRAST